MYYPLSIRFDVAGTTADSAVFALNERVEVLGGYVTVNSTIAADGSDYATAKVLGNDGATAIYARATDATALTADTPAALVSEGNQEIAIFDAGEPIIVQLAKTGSSGVAFDGVIVLNCRAARKY